MTSSPENKHFICEQKKKSVLNFRTFTILYFTSSYFSIFYSAQETIESLCLLCIQAFAELNSWQDVLPYIQNVYSGIEGCPSAVIRLW